MTAQKGRELLLKVEATPGGGIFNAVAGMRSNGITINNELVDVTTKSSAGVKKLLAGAGVNSVNVSGSGIADDDANLELVRASALANTNLNYQLVVPGASNGGTYEGAFGISSFEVTGEYGDSVQFSITLESDGTVSFT